MLCGADLLMDIVSGNPNRLYKKLDHVKTRFFHMCSLHSVGFLQAKESTDRKFIEFEHLIDGNGDFQPGKNWNSTIFRQSIP